MLRFIWTFLIKLMGGFLFFQGPETSRMVEAKITVFHVCNCFDTSLLRGGTDT